MSTASIKKIFGLLFLVNLVHSLYGTLQILDLWSPLSEYFVGVNYYALITRLLLHYALLLGVSVSFFMCGLHVRIIVFLYFILTIIEKIWVVQPNSLKYQQYLSSVDIESILAGREYKAIDSVKSIINHTLDFNFILVLCALIFVFFFIKRKKAKRVRFTHLIKGEEGDDE